MSVLDSLQNTNVLFIYYNDYKNLKIKNFELFIMNSIETVFKRWSHKSISQKGKNQ